MTPVQQRVLASVKRGDGCNGLGIAGDCWRAVLASLFDLPYEAVPHAANYPAGFDPDTDPLVEEHGSLAWRRSRRWARTLGRDLAYYTLDDLAEHPVLDVEGGPWVGYVGAVGPSPRGAFRHAVVGHYRHEGGRPVVDVVHDPHPSRAGLTVVEGVDLIVGPYDPPPPEVDE